MNAIDILTREELNRQYWLNECRTPEEQQQVQEERKRVERELANIERALEILKAESLKKTGVEV